VCSGQLSLLLSAGQEMSSSSRATGWRPSVADWDGGISVVLQRGSICSLLQAMDGRIMRRGIISSCQSAATSESQLRQHTTGKQQFPWLFLISLTFPNYADLSVTNVNFPDFQVFQVGGHPRHPGTLRAWNGTNLNMYAQFHEDQTCTFIWENTEHKTLKTTNKLGAISWQR